MLINTYDPEALTPPKYLKDFIFYDESKTIKENIEECVKKLTSVSPLPIFTRMEIETINRCNNVCSFCPVNKNNDSRVLTMMGEPLFYSIIDQLKSIQYTGELALCSNNEPLLDSRIINFAKYTKQSLPGAFVYLMTNGTLLNIPIFEKLMEYIDLLIIDNYSDDLSLIGPVQDIWDYCNKYDVYFEKIQIHIRKIHEVLTSRGGLSPNKTEVTPTDCTCILPFCQIVCRPSGKISLCCNDALGTVTLGDLSEDHILSVWYGKKYEYVRQQIMESRLNYPLCTNCDTMEIPTEYFRSYRNNRKE